MLETVAADAPAAVAEMPEATLAAMFETVAAPEILAATEITEAMADALEAGAAPADLGLVEGDLPEGVFDAL